MAREIHRLSAKLVEKTKRPGYCCDGGGLYLQASPTLSKSWVFRYTRHARSHEIGLGSERVISLAEARTQAERSAPGRATAKGLMCQAVAIAAVSGLT
jgi:hypothetical protein